MTYGALICSSAGSAIPMKKKARACHSSHPCNARPGSRFRARMGQCVHVSMRTARTLRTRPRHLRGRFRAPVSPFGARGGNSGIQDADNLCWKLARVVRNESPEQLLQTYDDERVEAANENILNSSRSTDFITPKSNASRQMRDAVLALSQRRVCAAAGQQRPLVDAYRASRKRIVYSRCDSFACALTPALPQRMPRCRLLVALRRCSISWADASTF